MEILYHMAFDKEDIVLSVRTMVEEACACDAQHYSDEVPAARWVEREIHEMIGVDFRGHPNMEHLLLPDDWEEGKYPYRKKTFDSEHEGGKPRNG